MTKRIITPSSLRSKEGIVPAFSGTKSGQLFNFSLRSKYILLALTGFIFYANTLFNKYAFDDNLAIETNGFVQMGIAGIPKILTNDAYASYYTAWGANPLKQLSGGRYRPLSEIIFAIEQQLFGNSNLLPYFRHLISILAYIACISVMFYFLGGFLFSKIQGGSDVAFLSAFLFAIHPLHTEVVANLKSLDEILSLLFILLTFIFSLKYLRDKKIKYLILGNASFFLALLSKEYAVTLLFFIPFLFYLLGDKPPVSAIKAGLYYYGVFIVYLAMRYYAVGFPDNTQNAAILGSNPYLYATHAQKVATEWFVFGKYMRLLFFPYPLSYDYSYYQIPYHSFSDITVLISLLIYISIFVWAIQLIRSKNVLSFALLFFLLNLFMISNFVLDIGATMGERLVFHSSLGFVCVLSYYFLTFISKMHLQAKKRLTIGIMALIGFTCLGETVVRNAQWKDDSSLDIHDVKVATNSFITNNNAGRCYLLFSEEKENSPGQVKAYRDSALKCLFMSLHFSARNEFTYINLGYVYDDEGQLDSAKYCYDLVSRMSPYFPLKPYYTLLGRLYFDKGLSLAKQDNKPHEGIINMRKALLIDSTNESIWYDLGVAYYHLQQYDSERYAFLKTLQYKPDSFDAAGAKKYLYELSLRK